MALEQHGCRGQPLPFPVVVGGDERDRPDDSEWPVPPQNSVLARYPLKFRSLLREALASDVVGRPGIEQALRLTYDEIDELIGASEAFSGADMTQEWDEYAALGAVPA